MINILSPDGQISFDEYIQATRSYNAEQGLKAIGRLSWLIDSHDPILEKSIFRNKVPNPVNQWQLAFFAKTLIERSNDFKRKTVDDEDLILACNLYNNIRDPFIGNDAVEFDRRDLLNFFVRTSYEEFPLQTGNHGPELARAYFLFEEIAKDSPKEIFDIGAAFAALSGMTVREFITTGFVYWAHAGQVVIPTPIRTGITSLSDILTPEKQGRFLALVSTGYEGFRSHQERQPKKTDFEKFEFNCLQTFPLIRTQRSKLLLCPIPAFLLRRFTRGIYYYLLDAHSGAGKENKFSSFFGKHIFEPYVGLQLKGHFGEARVFAEKPLGKSEMTCDWMVVEDDSITLVECKTSSLTSRAKSFADTKELTEDVKRRLVKGVQACERTRDAITKGQISLGESSGRKFRNLIVLYDEALFFNSPSYQELVDAELNALGLNGVRYQVVSIADLEYVLPAISKFGLGRFLNMKEADPDRRHWDFSIYLQRLVEESIIGSVERNLLLDEKYEALFGEFLPGKPLPPSDVS